jgi:hypothetical protein
MPVVRELDAAHERAAKALQAIVTDEFSGREFASPQAQQHIIDRLRDLLMRLERRLECPVCHEPAMPKFTLGRTEGAAGHLQYRHSAADIRATHGGGSVFPQAKILPAPPGARRK